MATTATKAIISTELEELDTPYQCADAAWIEIDPTTGAPSYFAGGVAVTRDVYRDVLETIRVANTGGLISLLRDTFDPDSSESFGDRLLDRIELIAEVVGSK